mgnify:CR=1 FL=1
MGFTETLKAAMDSSRKYQLSREMTIDEVYQILVSAGLDPEEVGSFELKKGLGAKSIVFSGGTIAYPTLTVHGSEARLQKIIKQKGKGQFRVLGVRLPNGDTPWSSMSEADQGSAYFKSVGDALNKILQS